MVLELTVNGRARRVSVERVGSAEHRFHVTVDGVTRQVNAVRVGPSTLSLVLEESGAGYDVAIIESEGPGRLTVYLPGGVARAVASGRAGRFEQKAGSRGGDAAGDAEAVIAPMPGRVVRVLVAAGDAVAARQGVVVIEAMKMENELGATRPGRVREVCVRPGMPVEAGRVLAVIE